MHMKPWMYPLFIVIGASCYGILSTIIKLAIHDGFTASEAVTAQYYTGFLLALIIFYSLNEVCQSFEAVFLS